MNWRSDTDTTKIEKIIRKFYKMLYAHNQDNMEEMDKFLETHNLLRIEIENKNSEYTDNN